MDEIQNASSFEDAPSSDNTAEEISMPEDDATNEIRETEDSAPLASDTLNGEPAPHEEPTEEYVPLESASTLPRPKMGGAYTPDGRYVFPDGYYYDLYDNYISPLGTLIRCAGNSEMRSDDTDADNRVSAMRHANEKKLRRVRIAFLTTCIAFGIALIALCTGLIYNVIRLNDPTVNRPEVNIVVSDKGPTVPETGLASQETLEKVNSSVVIIKNTRASSMGLGSGFIISSDGYIVTNHHVVSDTLGLTVTLYSGKTYGATLIGSDEKNDIAVIKISETDLPAIDIGQSKYCYTGERVYAIGCPSSASFGWSVSMGIISHPSRDFDMYDDDGGYTHTMKLIQTDATVNHGNSGGPLINTRGEVVGIVTLGLANTTGIYFAVPMDTALPIIKQIMEDGGANNPVLGINCFGVIAGSYYYISEDGRISEVSEGTAAQYPDRCVYASITGIYVMGFNELYNAKDVLKKGDIICSMAGTPTVYQSDITQILLNFKAGDSISITVYRDGEYLDLSLVLMEKQA